MKRASVALVLALSTAAYAQTVVPTVPQKPTKPMIDAAERYFRDGVRFTEAGNYDERGRRTYKGSLPAPSASRSGI